MWGLLELCTSETELRAWEKTSQAKLIKYQYTPVSQHLPSRIISSIPTMQSASKGNEPKAQVARAQLSRLP